MKLLVVLVSLLWLVQAAPPRLLAKTPFDQASVRNIFDQDELFVDSNHQPLEEDISSDHRSSR